MELAMDMSAEGTGRQQVEAPRSDSEERFQAIFAQAAVGIAQIGLDGTWLLVNVLPDARLLRSGAA